MKRITALFLTAVLLLGITACNTKPDFTMPTGCIDGVYHRYGKDFAETVKEQSGLVIKPYSTDGAKANMTIIDETPENIGLAQADILNHSWNETNIFKKEGKIDSLRAIGCVFTEQLMLVTTDPSVRSVEQLKGKVVSLGSVYSGANLNAMDLLDAMGLEENDLPALRKKKKIKNFNLTASLEALEEGEIDAAFITTALPSPALTKFMEEQPLYLVPFGQEYLDQLQKENGDYFQSEIPAQSFTDQKKDVSTLGVKTVLFCGADCEMDEIYEIAKIALKEIDLDFACSDVDLPFHQGAAKYFAEQGINVYSK
ncbi:MAG: TAXI family TRAP transporter solute-binding subunit [Clostridia bacterium]|nr:TAXI family TRAP transporter solute-binding subunit [Clostridia bacterium]